MSSSSFTCSLCPTGASPAFPDAMITLADTAVDCATLDFLAPDFSDDPSLCRMIQQELGELCGCERDNCSQLSFTSCSTCTSASASDECVWCPTTAKCASAETAATFLTCPSPYEWVDASMCSALVSTDAATNVFSDPLYDSMSWAYNLINVEPVWRSGIYGTGVNIRINDGGVDASHPEFAGKFDYSASCENYAPASLTGEGGLHGTTTASIAAASGNNGCAVGIAPGATISSCNVVPDMDISADELEAVFGPEFFSYHTVALDKQHISSNSYGGVGCQPKDMERRRKLQQGGCMFRSWPWDSPCPYCSFSSSGGGMLSSSCKDAITLYCTVPSNYDQDDACVEYLEIFADCHFNGETPEIEDGMIRGIKEGRDGKGIVYVWAAGNERSFGSDTNFDWYTTLRFVITVGAVDQTGKIASYSNPGAGVFVTAPGGDMEYETNFVTAMAGGGCYDASAGTSFACPLVAGVVALMLEVNPNLGWRDVQGVLATTSQQVDTTNSDAMWVTNAAGLMHSNLYGFGVVDANSAVTMAKNWTNFGPERVLAAQSGDINLPISPQVGTTTTSTLNVPDSAVVESVVIYLEMDHSSRGHLEIVITSPSGTQSIVSPGQRPENTQLPDDAMWKLMTVAFWNEESFGDWTISITDTEEGDVSQCVDLPVLFDFNFTEVSCSEMELIFDRAEACSDAEVLEVCCFCGGGQASSSVVGMLRSWRLFVYGHDQNSNGGDVKTIPASLPTAEPGVSAQSSEQPVGEVIPQDGSTASTITDGNEERNGILGNATAVPEGNSATYSTGTFASTSASVAILEHAHGVVSLIAAILPMILLLS